METTATVQGKLPTWRWLGIVVVLAVWGVAVLYVVGFVVNGPCTIVEAKLVRAAGDIEVLKASLWSYQHATGMLPTTGQNLQALLTKPADVENWLMPLIEPDQLIDPWNKKYLYVQPGTHNPEGYDLFSAGPDGQPHTPDDIGNWNKPAAR